MNQITTTFNRHCLTIIFTYSLCLFPHQALAVGEKIVENVMRSDFVFDRGISNVPFFPLGYFSADYTDSIELSDCSQPQACEFSYLSIDHGLGLPVWMGQKNMIILGESLELDRIKLQGQTLNLTTGGLLVGWIQQTSPEWQTGAFLFAYDALAEDETFKPQSGSYSGLIGRFRHDERFHSYWGVVRAKEQRDAFWYPYAGFDWYLDQKWFISMVFPWPAISYAPTPDQVFRLGAYYSGSDWTINTNDQLFQNSFSKIDLGISYEKRLSKLFWFETKVGYSGLGRYSIDSDASLDFKTNTSSSPVVSVSINLRPE